MYHTKKISSIPVKKVKVGIVFIINNVISSKVSLTAKLESNKVAADLVFWLFLLNLLKTKRVRILPSIPKIHKLPIRPTDIRNL